MAPFGARILSGRPALARLLIAALALVCASRGASSVTGAPMVIHAPDGGHGELAFGVEMEFAGVGPMRVLHINDMPAANYEAVLAAVAAGVSGGAVEAARAISVTHDITHVPHPKLPNLPSRRVRTSSWTDALGRTWKVTSEYVSASGVYDGYEVVSPPLVNPREAEAVAAALWSSGLLAAGVKSATHVHVNGSCLVGADGSALGAVNMILLNERFEPLIRRLFRTRHLGGSNNPFSRPLGAVHPTLVDGLASLAASARTVDAVRALFEEHLVAELRHVGLHGTNAPPSPDGGEEAQSERFNRLKRVWKYHSLNVANLLPVNPSIPPRKKTVEFRAFDLLGPEALRLAVVLSRALVARACALGVDGVALGQVPIASLGGGSEDAAQVRALSKQMLAELGLDAIEFAPLLNALDGSDPGKDFFPSAASGLAEDSALAAAGDAEVRCDDGVCHNGGTCVEDLLGKGVECVCPLGFEGSRCSHATDTASSVAAAVSSATPASTVAAGPANTASSELPSPTPPAVGMPNNGGTGSPDSGADSDRDGAAIAFATFSDVVSAVFSTSYESQFRSIVAALLSAALRDMGSAATVTPDGVVVTGVVDRPDGVEVAFKVIAGNTALDASFVVDVLGAAAPFFRGAGLALASVRAEDVPLGVAATVRAFVQGRTGIALFVLVVCAAAIVAQQQRTPSVRRSSAELSATETGVDGWDESHHKGTGTAKWARGAWDADAGKSAKGGAAWTAGSDKPPPYSWTPGEKAHSR